MAKKRSSKKRAAGKKQANGVNKSHEIRKYKARHPDSKPKAISAALAKRGIDVSPTMISNVLSQDKKKRAEARAAGGGTKTTATRRSRPDNGAIDQLTAAAQLIAQCGGADQAIKAVKGAEQIRKTAS